MYIAVDFDGTCVDHRHPLIGPDVPGAVETLRKLNQTKHKLILWTMRSGKELQEAIEWFRKNNIVLFGIQRNPTQSEWTSSPKCYANLYIDDSALGAPLIIVPGFARMCIDWTKVKDHLGLV